MQPTTPTAATRTIASAAPRKILCRHFCFWLSVSAWTGGTVVLAGGLLATGAGMVGAVAATLAAWLCRLCKRAGEILAACEPIGGVFRECDGEHRVEGGEFRASVCKCGRGCVEVAADDDRWIGLRE